MDEIIKTTKPDITKLPGGWETEDKVTLKQNSNAKVNNYNESIKIVDDFLSYESCDELLEYMNKSQNFEYVDVQGKKTKEKVNIGSYRTTIWSINQAEEIWNVLKEYVEERSMKDTTSTDWWQEGKFRKWKPIALSPILRFMTYKKGGQHYPHYDAGFIYGDSKYRTLSSVLIYLTNNANGATRFIKDGQEDKNIWDRDHSDWTRIAKDNEIITKVDAVKGRALIFDHRLCHDAEQYNGDNDRSLIRADLVYRIQD